MKTRNIAINRNLSSKDWQHWFLSILLYIVCVKESSFSCFLYLVFNLWLAMLIFIWYHHSVWINCYTWILLLLWVTS